MNTSDSALLVMFHCEQHTGYAIEKLEHVFHQAALAAGYGEERIFRSYPKVVSPGEHLFECDYNNERQCQQLAEIVVRLGIKTVLAFDLAYPARIIPWLRKAGVSRIISYWGASMSSVNSGVKLFLKRTEWYLRRQKPDIFVFESEAMRETAIHGRGVPERKTCVIPLGVDTDHYRPDHGDRYYAYDCFNIPRDRDIVFYSGHMEPRKGIATIMRTADHMVSHLNRRDVHFLLCGNKGNEEAVYLEMLRHSSAIDHVTFAGYRNDVQKLHRSCRLGVIASSGWDSFTMSSVEMMSSGLPMVISRLQGLQETIAENVNGFFFEPENWRMFAEKLIELLDNPQLLEEFSAASRRRAMERFSVNLQIKQLSALLGNGVQ
jgi:glycosyltransferase involved in cell wall biosynthesis